MIVQQIVAPLLILNMLMTGPGMTWAGAGAPPPPGPAPADAPSSDFTDVTPPRVSYLSGEVSFWRPGAQDWTAAALNTPLSPGDVLYTAQGGNVEIQVGPCAFVRASDETQLGIDNQEPDFLQLRVTAGHAALDVRALEAGHSIEVDTPNAAFTIERAGYYHVDVAQESTTFRVHRGGTATMTPAGGTAAPITANQQAVVTGADPPRVDVGAAVELTAWDRWNYQRTDQLLAAASARYVGPAVYGTDALDQHGSWRTVETYGRVWVPAGVPAGWAPYSAGRWIWDPRFGWTWLDDAPWGWAPYHYGRWVFLGPYWAWAPGPVIARPVYAPALVVFLGGGVIAKVGRPVCWAPLGWGEPLVPWWGRRGFVGRPWWGGWGGPRVINNVVVNRTTHINVTNISVYKNVNVTNAVVGVPADRFGHGAIRPTRFTQAEARQLTPVRGALAARPVAASLTPASGPAAKPPAAIQSRAVVATRAPRDVAPALRAHGLGTTPATSPAPRLVPSPKPVVRSRGDETTPRRDRVSTPQPTPGKPGTGPGPAEKRMGSERTPGNAARPSPPPLPASRTATPQRREGAPPDARVRPEAKGEDRPRGNVDRGPRPAPSPSPARPPAPSRQTPPAPPAARDDAGPRARSGRGEPPARVEQRERIEPPARRESPAGVQRRERVERRERFDQRSERQGRLREPPAPDRG